MLETKSGNWDSYWKAKQGGRFTKISWSKKRILKILNKYLEKYMTVLDAGCGSGFFSSFFVENSYNTYVLDYSEKAIQLAKEVTDNKAKEYICEDLLNNEFAQKYFSKMNAVFSDGLLEHFPFDSQIKILNNLNQVLRPQGLIFTFVPNRYSLWRFIRPFLMPGISEKPFSLKELIAKHKKAGFEILECGGINLLPIAFSPDRILGKWFGMLVYVVARKQK